MQILIDNRPNFANAGKLHMDHGATTAPAAAATKVIYIQEEANEVQTRSRFFLNHATLLTLSKLDP